MTVIHRDPAPEQSGGGTEAVAPPAGTSPPGTPAPAPKPAEPPKISLTIEEYQRLASVQARLAEIEAEKQRELEAKDREKIDALAAKGEVERAITTQRDQYETKLRQAVERAETLERERLQDKLEATVSALMLGVDYVSDDAAADARAKLLSMHEAVRDASGSVTVRERGTFRPAGESIKGWLGSAASAHFRKASTTGGAGSRGGERTAATGAAAEPEDVNEVLIGMLRDKHTRKDTSYYGLTKITN